MLKPLSLAHSFQSGVTGITVVATTSEPKISAIYFHIHNGDFGSAVLYASDFLIRR
jgi:hypothetical protein